MNGAQIVLLSIGICLFVLLFEFFEVSDNMLHKIHKMTADLEVSKNEMSSPHLQRYNDICHSNVVSSGNFNSRANSSFKDLELMPLEDYLLGQRSLALFEEMMFFLNTPYLSVGGTMVGTLRHSNMVPWDHDFDVMIFASHFHRVLALMDCDDQYYYFQQYLKKSIAKFCQDYIIPWLKYDPLRGAMIRKYRSFFRIGEYAPSRRFSHLKLRRKNATSDWAMAVDIFPMHLFSKSSTVYIQSNDLNVPYEELFPFQKRPYGNHLISIPHQPYDMGNGLTGFTSSKSDMVTSCSWVYCNEVLEFFPFVTKRVRLPSQSSASTVVKSPRTSLLSSTVSSFSPSDGHQAQTTSEYLNLHHHESIRKLLPIENHSPATHTVNTTPRNEAPNSSTPTEAATPLTSTKTTNPSTGTKATTTSTTTTSTPIQAASSSTPIKATILPLPTEAAPFLQTTSAKVTKRLDVSELLLSKSSTTESERMGHNFPTKELNSLEMLKYESADRVAYMMNVTIQDIEKDEIKFQQTSEFFNTFERTYNENVTEKLIQLNVKRATPLIFNKHSKVYESPLETNSTFEETISVNGTEICKYIVKGGDYKPYDQGEIYMA